jgi:hypothetical protein
VRGADPPDEDYTQHKLTRELNKRTGFNYGTYRNGNNTVKGYRGIKLVGVGENRNKP